MATKSKTKDDGDAPLIDLNEASVKKLIAKAKRKGYITYDELNEALPAGEMSSDQIEDIQAAIEAAIPAAIPAASASGSGRGSASRRTSRRWWRTASPI